jgi:hypothetical protein
MKQEALPECETARLRISEHDLSLRYIYRVFILCDNHRLSLLAATLPRVSAVIALLQYG